MGTKLVERLAVELQSSGPAATQNDFRLHVNMVVIVNIPTIAVLAAIGRV